MKVKAAAAIFTLLATGTVLAQKQANQMSVAESQHEIVMLLIKEGRFERALTETGKLFKIPIPKAEEQRFVVAARTICGAFIRHQQHTSCLKTIDSSLTAVDRLDMQAELYKEKAFVLKKMGQSEEAMVYFQKAIDLQRPEQ